MNAFRLFVGAFSLVVAQAVMTTEARACGGCIVSQSETTQVTSHRMILSISPQSTTLWDQITYAGSPDSFAWVLPIKGTVEVGLSSDALFGALDNATRVEIRSPVFNCPLPPGCFGGGGGVSSSASSGGGGVVVLAEEVVGPYATVQLSSQDPNALKNWLITNGYFLPPDLSPIVDAYVNENFNFLALKLVPGQGIDSMRPVRVTSAGATPVLPLRMVALGTGQTIPITLFLLGEGRYEAGNFPNFTIAASQLIWNWDTASSNYSQVKQNAFDLSNGRAWLTEDAEPFSKYFISTSLRDAAQFNPEASGYGGDPMGPTAIEECDADLAKLWGNIPDNALWVTRLHSNLSRAALNADLMVSPSLSQGIVPRILNVEQTTGTPTCPPPPPWCSEGSSSSSSVASSASGSGMPDTNPWDDNFSNGNGTPPAASCSMSHDSNLPTVFGFVGLAFLLSLVRRHERR